MTAQDIPRQLEAIAGDTDFEYEARPLVKGWQAANIGVEGVEPILRFMEAHGDIDFGSPGPLVHFVESCSNKGYEALLVQSVERKPIRHTVWMLNRMINGAESDPERETLMALMKKVGSHPLADEDAKAEAKDFLDYQADR